MSNYAIYKLKYGYFRIEQEDGVVVSLRRLPEKPTEMGTPTTLTDTAANQLTEYFDGKRKVFDFSYRLHGTEFQKKSGQSLKKSPTAKPAPMAKSPSLLETPRPAALSAWRTIATLSLLQSPVTG